MARNEQVARILKVIHYLTLNPQGLRAVSIREKLSEDGFKVTQKTVYRDLEAIQKVNIPLMNEGKNDAAIWKLYNVAKIDRGVTFDYYEILALFIARESLKTLQGSPVYDILDNFFSRLEELLGGKAHKAIAEFTEHFGFKSTASWASGVSQEVINTLHAACAEGQLVEIDYQATSGQNAGVVKTRKLGPECIYFADSGIYLIAKDLKSGKHKTYSLTRMKRAEMLDETYESEGFSVDEYFSDSIGVLNSGVEMPVGIFVKEPIASYISERRWHSTQKIIRRPEGIEMTMTVKVNDELARWVLGLGPAARVLHPDNLKNRVEKLALEISEAYKKAA